MRDPHRILGVPVGATPEQIRKAYRALAREHHPDATGRAESAERFAAIATAYEQLIEATRHPARTTGRKQPPPSTPTPGEPTPDIAETAEVYDAFFAGPNRDARGGRAPRARRSPLARRPGTLDLVLDLPISPDEARLGASVEVPTAGTPIAARVPSGSVTGQEIRLPGLGMRAGGGVCGDLVVVLRVIPGSGDRLDIGTGPCGPESRGP